MRGWKSAVAQFIGESCSASGMMARVRIEELAPAQQKHSGRGKAPASEGSRYKNRSNPRGRGEPRPYGGKRVMLVRGFDFGFGDFFGDLGGSGKLGAVPAAAEGFDQLNGSGHFLCAESGELLLVG